MEYVITDDPTALIGDIQFINIQEFKDLLNKTTAVTYPKKK